MSQAHKDYRYGGYEDHLWDFRESEYLDDPDQDISEQLALKGQEAADRQESYSNYLDSPYWAKVRAAVFARAGHRCQKCGFRDKLQVHHKAYPARYTELENLHMLVLLCHKCHESHHH
jgi:hypothetical protein